MRRGGPQHPKVALLAAALTMPRYAAVGLLECLWHWTAQYAPHGDIGQYDNATIAGGVGWEGDATTLMTTLENCHFLDPHRLYRLVVHNWNMHADQTTQRVVSRSGRNFVSGRKVGRIAASQKLAKNYQKIASGGKAKTLVEHCVKTPGEQQEKATDPTALRQAAISTNSKPEATLIAEINRVSGRQFSVKSDANLTLARARLKDYPLAELCTMLWWRWRTWDEGMRANYFRPETLLGATKCEGYMGIMPAGERAGQGVVRPVARNLELERIAARDRELGRSRG